MDPVIKQGTSTRLPGLPMTDMRSSFHEGNVSNSHRKIDGFQSSSHSHAHGKQLPLGVPATTAGPSTPREHQHHRPCGPETRRASWQLAKNQRAAAATSFQPHRSLIQANQHSAPAILVQNKQARTPFPPQHSPPQDLRAHRRARSVSALLQPFRRFKSIHHNTGVFYRPRAFICLE